MKNIKIICDSLSDIPKEVIKEYDIEVISLTIILGEEEYKDSIELSKDEFYKRLRNENLYPKTSQATYNQFKEVFKKSLKEYSEVLYIAGSSVATSTYENAIMAKNDVSDRIYIYDSQTFSGGAGLLALEAAKLARNNYSIEKILEKIEEIRLKTVLLFSVDTLEYIQKGGRISSTKAAIGHILNIKPILEVKEGLASQVSQVRGKKHVISKIVETIREKGIEDLSNQTIYVGYSDDLKEKERLIKAVKEELNPKEIEVFQIGVCIGAHVGPGTTGIICFKE